MTGLAVTRTAAYPDGETARWCAQEMLDQNEEEIGRWLAEGTRDRLTLEGYWPSRVVGKVALQAMVFADREPVDVRAARVVLRRSAHAPLGFVVQATFPMYV